MIVKGPFNLRWGDNVIEDVEEIEVESDVDRSDYNTVQGRTFTIDGSRKSSATLTLLSTDIAVLAALLPQFFVPNGGVMSTGETVNEANGAIDISALRACSMEDIYEHLEIEACGQPGEVMRLVRTRTSFETSEFDGGKIRKIMIVFLGEPEGTQASIQFFKEGTIGVVS